MRQEIADQITSLMMEYQSRLNASTLLVQQTCSPEEFQTYRHTVGRVTDYMFMELSKVLPGSHSEAGSLGNGNDASDMSDMNDMIDASYLDDPDDVATFEFSYASAR